MQEKTITYLEHEAEMVRMELTQSRLWITSLILIGLLVGSNALWIIYTLN